MPLALVFAANRNPEPFPRRKPPMLGRSTALAFAALLAATSAFAQDHSHMPASVGITARAPIFDLGSWRHRVTTTSSEAQRYFDQGLVLAYGFNHAQAIAAFTEAARLDSTCAMAFWGIALAHGPNINFPMDSTAEKPAWDALQKAVALAPAATESEQAFIRALARRYADPLDPKRPSRASMDSAYASAMREVWKGHPSDADAGALLCEALMDLNPWNFWTLDGKANPGTDEIVATLEAVLGLAPDHPGANHFYIHAVEASRTPGRAVASAERLATLVPDAGHLVHMPSHIWHRVGRYADSEDANVRAARVDSLYLAAYKPEGLYPMMYVPHNIHFTWSAACMEGRREEAVAAARRLEPLVPVEMLRQMPMLEFVSPTVLYALVRFGRWSEILAEPAPPADLRFTSGMWHWARGLAFTATGKQAQARAERDSVQSIAASTPAGAMVSFNSAAALLRLAAHALNGEIAARRGRVDEAARHFRDAIAEESALHYDEPPAWFLPVRQQLGAVLLAAGRIAAAEAAYREDLVQNPENGWSLFGLAKCLRARKADQEASAVEARFRKAWARADVSLSASRF
jgi:tetratricopeptide (TPR) repeat protein